MEFSAVYNCVDRPPSVMIAAQLPALPPFVKPAYAIIAARSTGTVLITLLAKRYTYFVLVLIKMPVLAAFSDSDGVLPSAVYFSVQFLSHK